MTFGQAPGVDDLRSAQAEPCPCGHGDVAAEMAHQRPLLDRAAAGDPRAFAQLYDENVDDVYRYLLAWTADEAAARELTEQVFANALTWLPAIAGGDGDLAAWLLTSARDAVVQHRGAGWAAEDGTGQPAPEVLLAFNQLDDAHREVVVLRLLLGHSLGHTAHLAGYSPQVVGELQLAACANLWERLSGAPIEPGPPGAQEQRPRWFERCLEGAYLDPGGDSALQDVMAVADAVRQAAAQQVPLPDDAFVQRLRQGLLAEMGGAAVEPRPGRTGLAGVFAMLRFHVSRHPWAATMVAASAIGLILGLQIAGGSGTRSACGDGPCLASTTDTTVADQAGVGVPTIPTLGATTLLPTTTAPPTTQPPTTRPPSTAPATAPPTTAPALTTTTTKAPGPPTSHGRPTTTAAPTTTVPPTTTTTLSQGGVTP
jgi:DNA-directed RNA polymerase specialized sigma24 family protein